MRDTRTFVIIGAGQAGGWIAKTLRAEEFTGRVVLIGEEPYLPYERPPLSKAALLGEVDSTYFWPPETYDALDIEVLPGTRATAIDRATKQVSLDNGDTRIYDRLAITTGTRPRLLPIDGAELTGIHYLRSIDDSLAIRADIGKGSKVLIVGGGWIGLEVAATLSKLGCRSVVVEAADRLCGRAVTPDMSNWMLKFHQDNGVEVRLGTVVERFEGVGKLERALLSNGESIDCAFAVIGIGVIANTELAADAGIAVDNGIIVDDLCRTSDLDIFSAGDVTNHPNKQLNRRIRLESWENAQNQGIAAAKSMLDKGEAYGEIPWFWSDQHDANIQMIGLPEDWDETATRENPAEAAFLTMYLKGGIIVGAISVNNAREIRVAKRLMQAKKVLSVDYLANTDIKMQAMLKA